MNIKDVESLAELARIELSEEEKKSLIKDFDSILGYVQQIQEIDAKEIKKENKLHNVWREDELAPREFSRKLIIEQFPDSQDGYLRVKKIL